MNDIIKRGKFTGPGRRTKMMQYVKANFLSMPWNLILLYNEMNCEPVLDEIDMIDLFDHCERERLKAEEQKLKGLVLLMGPEMSKQIN